MGVWGARRGKGTHRGTRCPPEPPALRRATRLKPRRWGGCCRIPVTEVARRGGQALATIVRPPGEGGCGAEKAVDRRARACGSDSEPMGPEEDVLADEDDLSVP